MSQTDTAFTVNLQPVQAGAAPDTPLLQVLRNDLQLKGTRQGCGAGACGSCTVLVDGRAITSCDTPLWAVQGRQVTTIEGLGTPVQPHKVQQAFVALQAAQCGYCINGVQMAVAALAQQPGPVTEADLQAALARHLCRCGTHLRIVQAAQLALGLTGGPARTSSVPAPAQAGAAPEPTALAVPGPLPADIANNPMLDRWVRVGSDGFIDIQAGKVELGQGLWVTQLQVAAEELDVAPQQLRLRVGDTALCPDQGLTAGSLSTEIGAMALRRVCAEVRQLFVQAAATRLGVAPGAVRVAEGRFFATAGGASLSYGELAASVDLQRAALGDVAPKAAAARRLCGTSLPRPDLLKKLFGAAFIHDIEWPGMLHGRVVRPPALHAHSPVFDPARRAAVQALPGVHTLHVDGRWLGVAAEREEQAVAAAEALRRAVSWQDGAALPQGDGEQAWLRRLPSIDSVVDHRGDDPISAAAGAPDITPATTPGFSADYSRPHLAHASIGPSCALARWDAGRLTVCSHTQGSHALRRELATFFDLPAEHVTVVHADGAGCYGHNGADDVAVDAALLARAAGRPVRLQWSREDELAWAPCGPAMSVRIEATLDAQGRIAHWQHQTWSHSHVQRPGLHAELSCLASQLCEPPAPVPPTRDFPLPAGGGHRNAIPIYALPARHIGYHLISQPVLRTSALRALGGYANVFAIESAMDELAAQAGQDPLQFRLAHLQDARAAAVLQAAAAAAGWGQALPPASNAAAVSGRGLGLARYKNSAAWCAVVVEIEVAERIVLKRVWVAVDAGEVVHRDGLLNQIEGGVLQAASWTLKEAVQWDAHGSTTRSWDDYPILNFDDIPAALHVTVLPGPTLPPLGVGECAAGPTAAAIANALADALGVRARHLPLTPQRLLEAVQAAQA